MLILLIAGCGGNNQQVRPTIPPTRIPDTPTPRSSPLPLVSKAPALGAKDREIVVQFVRDADSDLALQNTVNELTRQLDAGTDDVLVEIGFEDERTALNALCSGAPRAAWISAFTYLTAEAHCDVVPVLAVQRGQLPNMTIGRSADIITRIDVDDFSQLAGRAFCRSQEHDIFTTWIFPSLLMTAEGFDPTTQLGEVREYPDDLTLARALYEGDCAGAALPPDVFQDVIIDLAPRLGTVQNRVTASDIMDYVQILIPAGTTTLPVGAVTWTGFDDNVVPYEVLVFAPETVIPAALRDDIVSVIEDFFSDQDDGADRASELLGADAIMSVEASDYRAFRTLVAESGWNMTFAD